MNFPDRQPVPLWSKEVPYSLGNDPVKDIPTITAYFPQCWKKNRRAVVIMPGGGYGMLAEHEGHGYAEWLASEGVTAFVVKYRLGSNKYRHPAELSDAARGIRLVRANAEALGIRPDCIGIMGSSAGGHLAASCATLHEYGFREEGESKEKNFGRPDFSILCYPVISGTEPFSHFGSFQNLLGETATEELMKLLSMEKSVDAETPPAFIWHTFEDTAVPVENSIAYASALKNFNIPFELHIYEKGHHGIGLAGGHPWAEECLRWLNDR